MKGLLFEILGTPDLVTKKYSEEGRKENYKNNGGK